MKVLTDGTLLLYLVGFLSFVLLSSQMNHNGRQGGNNNIRGSDIVMRSRTIKDTTAGVEYILPNGNVYQSTGNQPIMMFYNVRAGMVLVEQPPGSQQILIGPGTLPPAPYHDWPGRFQYSAQP